jgi:Zn-dependent metalloprotease
MSLRRLVGGVVLAGATALGWIWGSQGLAGQALPGGQAFILSQTEAGQGLTIRQLSSQTGAATFAAATDGRGVLLAGLDGASAETRARGFVQSYGTAFGVSADAELQLLGSPDTDALGVEHVRFQQVHFGVPVTTGDFLVHLRGSRVLAANGHIVSELPADTAPGIAATDALREARGLVARLSPAQAPTAEYSTPRLEIFDKQAFESSALPPRLAWFIAATDVALREFIWVDAQSGVILHHLSQLAEAKNRSIYTAGGGTSLPGSLVRVEGGGVTGDPDEDKAYDYSGVTYDYYLSAHARDSFDNAGGALLSTAHYGVGYQNAFWNGTQMVYGDGFASADDVVAHELTHAVTERTANLYYYSQSGALNESFSDIFGETIDLSDGVGNDASGVRWQMGEDLSIGAIRNMMTPTAFGDPGKMSDAQLACGSSDGGGVHTNSGIPNHAYALMVDGGTYNGRNITGIGLTKAGKIEYRALTTYLTSGSTFLDDYNALNQSCTDLIGTNGISTSDCTQVKSALDAVEMNKAWACTGAVAPPPLCSTGNPPSSVSFSETWESGAAAWSVSSTSATQWTLVTNEFAQTGQRSMYGADPASTSDHKLYTTAGVVIPAGGRLSFDHAFEFENSPGTNWDGGVIEYSTNGGSTWTDAGGLIDAGQAYGGTMSSSGTNPLGGRSGFVRSSYGFTATQLNLSSLAGQTVKFRFRVGSDSSVGSIGWFVDDLAVYSCGGSAGGEFIQNGNFSGGTTNWLTYALPNPEDIVFNTSGSVFQFYRTGTQAVVFQETGLAVPSGGPLEAVFDIGNSTTAKKRMSVLIHDSDFSDLSVCTFWLEPGAALATYRMRTHTTKAWTNATISFYAANTGNEGGGFYRLDNASLKYKPGTVSAVRTDCVDPTAPVSGGSTSGELLTNGTFTSALTPWTTFGNLSSQLTSGVFEFFKLAGLPSGTVFQNTGQAMANDQRITATFQLGNSSGLRQRVTVLVQEADFSDLAACTFWVPPGLPLSDYAVRTYATKAWTNATLSVYPASVGTAPANQWLQLDNASLKRTTTAITGTECFEPGTGPPS